ncbi:MAG: ankyrin repeat domain-containing protein, partial [Chloroflexota bacterium]
LQEHGEAHEIVLGTKHFSPNTKVYCFPPQWGDGYEKIKVAGRHRGARGLRIMVIQSKRLINWRVKQVYDPFVVRNVPEWRKARAELMVAAILIGREAEQAQRDGFEHVSADDALIYALRLHSLDAAQQAIERGADVNTRRGDGWTALGMAILYGGIAGVQWVLDQGARVDTVGVYARTSVQATPSLFAPETVRLVKQAADS